ncbi:MAG: hypothetical protein ACLFTA_02665, partial [Candidatus Nanohaloarchaea archaeon]
QQYIQEMERVTSEFLESGGRPDQVIRVIEEDLNIEGVESSESLRDLDYSKIFGEREKIRFYLWSARRVENKGLADKGINKMIDAMKEGEYDKEFLRKCREDISQLNENILSNKETLMDNLEDVEYKLARKKAEIAQDTLQGYEQI